jgi:hypothetical protein
MSIVGKQEVIDLAVSLVCRQVEISSGCRLSSRSVFLVKVGYFRLVANPDITPTFEFCPGTR